MGHTDMRKGMQGLALMVQQQLHRDPHGDLFVFRRRIGSLVKIIWHDGLGMSLYAKRLEKGRFVWPSAKDGAVALTSSQLGTVRYFVREAGCRQMTNLSPKITANWLFASPHSRGGRFHSSAA